MKPTELTVHFSAKIQLPADQYGDYAMQQADCSITASLADDNVSDAYPLLFAMAQHQVFKALGCADKPEPKPVQMIGDAKTTPSEGYSLAVLKATCGQYVQTHGAKAMDELQTRLFGSVIGWKAVAADPAKARLLATELGIR